MSNDKSQILPKTEPTPGSWKSDEHGCLMAGDKQIAAIFPKDRKANTPLFENAKEMYEALKWVIDQMRRFERIDLDTNQDQIQEILLLLAKIEGA